MKLTTFQGNMATTRQPLRNDMENAHPRIQCIFQQQSKQLDSLSLCAEYTTN